MRVICVQQELGSIDLLRNFKTDMFLHACILAGCDYQASVSGMGIKTAMTLVGEYKKMEKVFRVMRQRYEVPQEYEKGFWNAVATFKHARVYDPKLKRLVHLNPIRTIMNVDKMGFLGADMEPEQAQGVAEGHLNPRTYKPYDSGSTQLTVRRSAGAAVDVRSRPSAPIMEAQNQQLHSYYTAKETPISKQPHRPNEHAKLAAAAMCDSVVSGAVNMARRSKSTARESAASSMRSSKFFAVPPPAETAGVLVPETPDRERDTRKHESRADEARRSTLLGQDSVGCAPSCS